MEYNDNKCNYVGNNYVMYSEKLCRDHDSKVKFILYTVWNHNQNTPPNY